MTYREIFSGLAIALTFVIYVPYVGDIFKGVTKPHVFSWVIWGATTFVVFFAQLAAQGGVGAWPIGVSGSITLFVAALAYLKRADVGVTKTDWAFFLAAMSSLPLWYYTSDPLWAVVIRTAIDLLGFGPSVRKVSADPYSESIPFFLLFAFRNALAVVALETYSLATILFPAAVGLGCALFTLLIVLRRRALGVQRAV
jgi:hypothetical protein